MCPDPELLSVFLDNELPSPWKERMAAHLAACPSCQERLDSLSGVSDALRADAAGHCNSAMVVAMARVRENLETGPWQAAGSRVAASVEGSRPVPDVSIRPARSLSLVLRPVRIPLPLAAAAAALLLFMTFFALRPASRRESGIPRIAAQEETIPAMDIPAILRYLEARDAADGMMVIELPDSRSFAPMGEPTFIQAADYRPGSRP